MLILVTSSFTHDCEIGHDSSCVRRKRNSITRCEVLRTIHQIASYGRHLFIFKDIFLFLVKSRTTNLKITTLKNLRFGAAIGEVHQDISSLDIVYKTISWVLIFEAFHIDRLSLWDIFLLFSSRGKGASFYFRGES